MLFDQLLVVKLIHRQGGRGFEIMPEPQRVAHFVHDQLF